MSSKKLSKTRSSDPFLARESQRYETPLPSREFVVQTLEDAGRPVPSDELAGLLDIAPSEREMFQRRLAAIKGDIGLIARQLAVDEPGELIQRVIDVLLRAQHLANAQRAVGALQVAAQCGEQLQLDPMPGNGRTDRFGVASARADRSGKGNGLQVRHEKRGFRQNFESPRFY